MPCNGESGAIDVLGIFYILVPTYVHAQQMSPYFSIPPHNMAGFSKNAAGASWIILLDSALKFKNFLGTTHKRCLPIIYHSCDLMTPTSMQPSSPPDYPIKHQPKPERSLPIISDSLLYTTPSPRD